MTGDTWNSIATLVAGGGALGLIAAIIVYVTRGAIATAVAQAGAREIVRLKADLDAEVEKSRRKFERRLHRDQVNAATILEQFRTGLTLEAEIRRQVATRKVDVIGKIIALGEQASTAVDEDPNPAPPEFTFALESLSDTLRLNSHLFSAKVVTSFESYCAALRGYERDQRANDPHAVTRLNDKIGDVLSVIRAELHVDETGS